MTLCPQLFRIVVLAIFVLKVAVPMYFVVFATAFAERAARPKGSTKDLRRTYKGTYEKSTKGSTSTRGAANDAGVGE